MNVWIRRLAVAVGFTAMVIVLMLWLSGGFHPKVADHQPAHTPPAVAATLPSGKIVSVKSRRIAMTESAMGSIKAIHESVITSKLAARVVEVKLKAGQAIKKGEVLVRLDDSELQARVREAQAAAASAKAVLDQAQVELDRITKMHASRVASQNELERAQTAAQTAQAALDGARQQVSQVQAQLEYAQVKSPLDGIVVDKRVDVGDTVMPGQIMATAYDPSGMQLIANVRESLVHTLHVGQQIGVKVDVLDKVCAGTISEIVPQSQNASRSFQVKVIGPCPDGIYSGMFGRLLIPLADEDVLLVPRAAVRRVGQLEQVQVVENGRAYRRAVRTGRLLDGEIEILSGLRGGEQVVVPDPAAENSQGI